MENFNVLFDNAGGIILVLDECRQAYYDYPEDAARDVRALLDGDDASSWEWLPEDETVTEFEGYKIYDRDDILDELAAFNPDDFSGNAGCEFFTQLFRDNQPLIKINPEHVGGDCTPETLTALRDGLINRGFNVEIGDSLAWPGTDEWPERARFESDWDDILEDISEC